MKKLPILLLFAFLAACGASTVSCNEKIWTGEFGLCLAEGWEQVSPDALKEKEVPMETLAAFHRTAESAGQRDNIVVAGETLPGTVGSLAYAEANQKVMETVPEYALIEKREVKINDAVTTLHIFTARPVPELPVRRFYQLNVTKGAKGYSFTGTLPFSIEEETEKTLIDMLLSVTLEESAE